MQKSMSIREKNNMFSGNDNLCVRIRLNLYELSDIGKTPQQVEQEIEPDNYIDRNWEPQPIADQVILTYKFRSQTDKRAFIESIPEEYVDFVAK